MLFETPSFSALSRLRRANASVVSSSAKQARISEIGNFGVAISNLG